jgi:uncharacterized protein YyaL (SSP411 family)/Zn-dependent protease with chaperone function
MKGILAAGALCLLAAAASPAAARLALAGRAPAGAPVAAAAPGATACPASPERPAGGGPPVAVPEPSPRARRYHRTGNVLWLVNVAWGLSLPALWLLSGAAARLRGWAERHGRRWPLVLVLFFAAYTVVNFVLSLPLAYYEGFAREHAYGLSTQTFGKWLGDALKSLALGIAGGAVTLWLPYLLLRRSPRRWWLYSGLAAVPLLFFVQFVAPIWIEPLFNRFGPMRDQALERRITALAARAGIPGGRVFEVDKSVDTTAVNAYVDGFLGSQRIVLWDTLLAKLTPPQVLFVVGHEMGHYVLGHAWQGIAFGAVLILAALYAVHRAAGGLLARWQRHFGFAALADPASLPLLELLFTAALLALSPVALGFSRHLEHEADRFGLELTRDNRAAATAFIQLQQANLSLPRPDAWYKLLRSSHPPLGERIDFCNRYRPWDQGEPLRYGHLFSNRLGQESSPYLLLHARNPVDWYPWGEEAFAKARREQRPIFLSIGYASCYWCHVMEREVFSDPAIAALMNRWFVSVKVDREERPDLDQIYLTAAELLGGSSGWPSSLFLTPDLVPFYAGTYFPPRDAAGRPGFPTVLRQVHEAWQGRRAEVEATAARLRQALGARLAERSGAAAVLAAEVPGRAAALAAARALAGTYRPATGGFGGPPSFPSPGELSLLWASAAAGGPGMPAMAGGRTMVLETLLAMGRGAIYDQLDGGFHRYTLDAEWRIPHFEKMLYDNAQLAELLARTRLDGERDPELERLARGTLDFLLAELSLPEGAFASAIDAETAGQEGAYYTWTAAELHAALGPAGSPGYDLLAPIFGWDAPPNLESGRTTLFLTPPLAEHAARLGLTREALIARMRPSLDALRAARRRRPHPRVDDQVLADWNGMAIAALARGGAAFGAAGGPRYLAAARRDALFVLGGMRPPRGARDRQLLHAWRAGRARVPALLDDYAYMIHGLLALAEVTGERSWTDQAADLAAEMERRLGDPQGGYFQSGAGSDLLVRSKLVADGAFPSGNAIAALDLVALAQRTGEPAYRQRAAAALRAFAPELERTPLAVPTLALAVLRYQEASAETPAAAVAAATASGGATTIDPGAAGPERQALAVVGAEAHLLAKRPLGAGDGGDRGGGGRGDREWRRFEVTMQIRDGWHVNANPPSLPFLVPTRIGGEVRGLAYPPAGRFRSAFAPDELAVYSGQAVIRGEAAPRATGLELTYQACNDRLCLPPVTRSLPLAPAGARR